MKEGDHMNTEELYKKAIEIGNMMTHKYPHFDSSKDNNPPKNGNTIVLIVGLIISFRATIKYNKGIF